jgi:hypothetical protein
MMFSITCPRHGSDVLVGSRRIRSLINSEAGIALEIECYCGRYVLLETGRNYVSQASVRAAA